MPLVLSSPFCLPCTALDFVMWHVDTERVKSRSTTSVARSHPSLDHIRRQWMQSLNVVLALLLLPLSASFNLPFTPTPTHKYTQAISDIDDTLKSSGGVSIGSINLGGIDTQYSRGSIYPGVFEFLYQITSHDATMPMNVALLTARAEEFKESLEIKENSKIMVKAREVGRKHGVGKWGVGPVLYGSVQEWVNQDNKGRRKFANFEMLREKNLELLPGLDIQYVFVGDTGEKDEECGEAMLRYYCEDVVAVFMHFVGGRGERVPSTRLINGRPVIYYRTIVGAAVKALKFGLLEREAVMSVVEAARGDLKEAGEAVGSEKFDDVERDVGEFEAI